MKGHHFSKFDPNENAKSKFEQLLDLFMQLLTYTNGDVGEAMQWLNELDKEYKLTDDDYGIGDFLEDLRNKGYINEDASNQFSLFFKMNQNFLFAYRHSLRRRYPKQ